MIALTLPARRASTRTVPVLAGALAVAAGVVHLLSAALPLALALVVAGIELARGRRGAAQAAVAGLAAMGLVDVVAGLELGEAALTWLAAGALWCARDTFPVVSPVRLPRRATAMALAGAVLLLLAALRPHADATFWMDSAGTLALWAGATRGLVRRWREQDVERAHVASLVRAHGADTLSAFKLRHDLRHRLYAGGLVGQRVHAGALLVAGDPVGESADLGSVLVAAQAEARAHGLAFGVVGGSEQCAARARELGWRAVYLGDEAMVPTGAMELSGGARKSLRKAVNRVARAFTAELHLAGELDAATLERLRVVAEAWRGGAPDRGFSMAGDRIADELLPEAIVVLARGADGAVGGFLHFVPVFGRPQMSLGMMCRDPAAPNGMTEFLVVRAAALLAERGIDEFSLNFAAFGRYLRGPVGPLQRAFAWALRVGDRWFQLERLQHFNLRFDPRWQARYLIVDRALALPRVAVAALQVEGHVPSLTPLR